MTDFFTITIRRMNSCYKMQPILAASNGKLTSAELILQLWIYSVGESDAAASRSSVG